MESKLLILVSGIPGAGKSYFADAVAKSDLGFPHVPLDRYICPLPEGRSFLDWVRTPACIDWKLVERHITDLCRGQDCQTPIGIRPDGTPKRQPGVWIKGGSTGYIIPGTHAFSVPSGTWRILKVFVDTPDHTLATRMLDRPVSPSEGSAIVKQHFGQNAEVLRVQRNQADLIINGDSPVESEVEKLRAEIKQRFK